MTEKLTTDGMQILRSLLSEWHDLFATVCVEGTKGADLIERTKLALFVTEGMIAQTVIDTERWRDVADELPQEAQELLFVRGDKVLHGAWIGGIFWHSNQKMAAAYWMPMPKTPNAPLHRTDAPAAGPSGSGC